MQARELLEPPVALLGVATRARLVPLAADQQQLVPVERHGPDRARRRVGADEHAVGRRPHDATGDRVRALRVGTRKDERAVEERVVGCDHHAARRHARARRPHDAVLVLVDLGRARVLVDACAARRELVGEAQQVLTRVELRLIVDADGGRDRVRQGCRLGERRRQARRERRLGLVIDL
jgi:hypothetical protein